MGEPSRAVREGRPRPGFKGSAGISDRFRGLRQLDGELVGQVDDLGEITEIAYGRVHRLSNTSVDALGPDLLDTMQAPSSKQGSQRAAIGTNFELGRHVGKGTLFPDATDLRAHPLSAALPSDFFPVGPGAECRVGVSTVHANSLVAPRFTL